MPNELHEPEHPTPPDATVTTSRKDRDVSGQNRASDPSASGAEPERERLDKRLQAVERALTESDAAVADVADGATATAERAELESRLDDIETRVEELEAATQALRGYAGSIRAVNREVERRADLALARASSGDGDRRDGRGPTTAEGLPSGDAIDAAVPDDHAGGGDDEGETERDSPRDGPLDRLRESV